MISDGIAHAQKFTHEKISSQLHIIYTQIINESIFSNINLQLGRSSKFSFKSAKKQSYQATEIIIADDGSNYKTKDIIKSFSKDLNLIHIWHKDNGFNKSEILNKAIIKVKNKYIIQIDGDIILHKDFIKDHVKSAKKNQFIHGSRVFATKKVLTIVLKIKKVILIFFKLA